MVREAVEKHEASNGRRFTTRVKGLCPNSTNVRTDSHSERSATIGAVRLPT